MGNTQPQSHPKLIVYIQTEKEFYNSGSVIQGVVFVIAHEDFSFDALYLRLQGHEFCEWFEGTSKNRKKYLGTQNFYADEHILYRYKQSLKNGKYSYPFALEISENIPGSFQSKLYDAKIEYKLIAYFTNFEKRSQRYFYNVPLTIREPFRQQMYQYQGEVEKQPTKWFCFKQGHIKMHAIFDRNVCFQGQKVSIQISVDNTKGKCDVNKINICLVQYTFISANNGVSRTYRKAIQKETMPQKIAKGQKKENLKITFEVKSIDQQTAISTLVANYYRLQVVANIGSVAKNQPTIYSPLFIMKQKLNFRQSKSFKKREKIIGKQNYKQAINPQVFKAPDFWFRMNRDLEVVNFKNQDLQGYSDTQPLRHQD